MSIINDRVELVLKESGLSMAKFGRSIGVSRASVSAWFLNRDIEIKGKYLAKIAEKYDIDILWLMGANVPMRESEEHQILRMSIEKKLMNMSEEDLRKLSSFIDTFLGK